MEGGDVEVTYTPYKLPLRLAPGGWGFLGTLGRTKDGNWVQCHECGKLFHSLGIHAARKHGLSKMQYRHKYGLARGTALTSENLRVKQITNYQNMSDEFKQSQREKFIQSRKNLVRDKVDKALETKNYEGRCPDQLIDKIKVLSAVLGRPPSSREFVKYYHGYLGTIHQTFGTWNNATKIAGMVPIKQGRVQSYTKESLQKMLEDFVKYRNRIPSSSDCDAGGVLPSRWTFTKHFGSWSNAVNQIKQEVK